MTKAALHTRFLYLSRQHSNQCGLSAAGLAALPAAARLQGSCCFPMNFGAYVEQRRELRGFAAVSAIPQDPYDVSAALAKRLTAYQQIALTSAQQRIYDRAKPLSRTKGPCCCRCWRWTAFGGQAKYLIARRHYNARQIAEVWSAEEGCGGPSRA